MLDIIYLLDYIQDDCTITVFDINKGEDIQKDLSLEEAKDFFREHNYELCSFEPTPKQNDYEMGITLNVEEAQ